MATRSLSASQGWFGLKFLSKKAIEIVPFYNRAMSGFKPLATRHAWLRRAPIANTTVNVSSEGHSVLMGNTSRCEIAKQLWWSSGNVQPPEDRYALEIFKFACTHAHVAFDIGCNTGLFAMMAAKTNRDLKVFAFDLLPEAISLLIENILINDLADQVFPTLLGVGEPGRMTIPISLKTSSVPTSLSTDFEFEQGVKVRIASLDSLTPFVPNNVSVAMKIDVEATEHNVFRFGAGFLTKHSPDMVCELLRRSQVTAFEKTLSGLGYSFFLIGPNGIQPKEHLEPHPKYRDWLFTTRPERFDHFVDRVAVA